MGGCAVIELSWLVVWGESLCLAWGLLGGQCGQGVDDPSMKLVIQDTEVLVVKLLCQRLTTDDHQPIRRTGIGNAPSRQGEHPHDRHGLLAALLQLYRQPARSL